MLRRHRDEPKSCVFSEMTGVGLSGFGVEEFEEGVGSERCAFKLCDLHLFEWGERMLVHPIFEAHPGKRPSPYDAGPREIVEGTTCLVALELDATHSRFYMGKRTDLSQGDDIGRTEVAKHIDSELSEDSDQGWS